MAVKTIYTCDECGTEQDTGTQFWTVGVTANCATYTTNGFVEGKSMQVCRPCLESFGIHVREKPKGEITPPVPSLEELIREIVQRCA